MTALIGSEKKVIRPLALSINQESHTLKKIPSSIGIID